MRLKSTLFFAFFLMLTTLPFNSWAIYQTASDNAVPRFSIKKITPSKPMSWKEKYVYSFLSKKMQKNTANTEGGVQKQGDIFAVASIFTFISGVGLGILFQSWAFIFLIGILLSLVLSIIGIIRIKSKPNERKGLGFSIVSIILCGLLLLLFVSTLGSY